MAKKRTFIQKLLMDCEEATTLSTKMVYNEPIRWLDKLRFSLHNIICPPCGQFHSDNEKLEKIIQEQSKLHKLDKKVKNKILEQLKE